MTSMELGHHDASMLHSNQTDFQSPIKSVVHVHVTDRVPDGLCLKMHVHQGLREVGVSQLPSINGPQGSNGRQKQRSSRKSVLLQLCRLCKPPQSL